MLDWHGFKVPAWNKKMYPKNDFCRPELRENKEEEKSSGDIQKQDPMSGSVAGTSGSVSQKVLIPD